MTDIATIDPREITITPVFKYIEVENIPKSETAGRAVMETQEVVEVRFAGSKSYSPIFPVHAFWQRKGNQVITYAERWPEQYRAFKEGNPQEALGTPLDMLRDYGVTPEQVSLCRALKIYSIEALHHLEGQGLKSLGMHGNKLKEAAAAYMAERINSRSAMAEIEALRAEVAALKAGVVPAQETAPDMVDELLRAADASAPPSEDDETKERLKREITALTGSRPRGNPSVATLEASLAELQGVGAQ